MFFIFSFYFSLVLCYLKKEKHRNLWRYGNVKNLYKIKYFSASTTPNRHFSPIILRFSLIRAPFKSIVTYCRWMKWVNVILRKHHSWRNTEQTTAHCLWIICNKVKAFVLECARNHIHEQLLYFICSSVWLKLLFVTSNFLSAISIFDK